MSWASTIARLQSLGFSQPQLAVICGGGQSTIGDLATGRTKEPRYSTGRKLLSLLEACEAGPVAGELLALLAARRIPEIVALLAQLEAQRGEPPHEGVLSTPPTGGAHADRREPARANPFPDLDRRAAAGSS
jgi:transcriptional regulator with XRE-family HTH domain